MVSFAKIEKDLDEDFEEPEPKPWWKCPCCERFCPNSSEPQKKKERKGSVAQAETELKKLHDSQAQEIHKIDAKFITFTFVPDFIIDGIFKNTFDSLPFVETSRVVLLMADVCGFTSLCESYCQKGVSGIDELASVLNGFMSTLSAMLLEAGGDILNFAGDAFLVQWIDKYDEKGMQKAASKAYKCAVALQTHQCLQTKNLDGTLRVKIGIAVEEVNMWILGSSEFLLFVASGPAIPAVQKAEDLCSPGDIIMSQEVYKLLKEERAKLYTTTDLEKGYVKVTGCKGPDDIHEPEPDRIKLFKKSEPEHISMAKVFSIPALREIKSLDELKYLSELTMVTILFVALLNVDITNPKVLGISFDVTLAAVKKFKGVLNKMLLFDKGCTFLVVFGLPGLKHSNDAARGIYCAEDIVKNLNEANIQVSIGVTSGACFCGIVGHPQRQEYTVIGNRVNLAARIMVIYNDQPIALNVDTYHLCRDELGHNSFVELPFRKMKGIDSAGTIYAYRKHITSSIAAGSTASFDVVEDSNLHGSDVEKDKIKQCIARMCNKEQREEMKEKTLLPVLIIKGQSGSGKSYLMCFTVDAALAIGCKVALCCVIPSYEKQPFFVVSQLIMRMLNMTMEESILDRENKLMSKLPSSCYSNLYLLNHLFNVRFPVPENCSSTIDFKTEKITELTKILISGFCEKKYALLAVENADFMDNQSWYIIHELVEEEKILVVLSLTLDFKEINTSASVLLLKAYMHINMESLEEDFFAPLLCWFLGVKAVNTKLFVYLKEKTDGRVQLLKEISLSPSISDYIDIVPMSSLKDTRIKKEFYVEQFAVLNDKQSLACDLKPGVDLKHAEIPTNINDAVKEKLNNLTIQDRLLLKRAAVLGTDFTLHSLESVSSGMKRAEVLQSICNLLANHIFSSVCTLENHIETDPDDKVPSVKLNYLNICFCFEVYLRTSTKFKIESNWLIGPYHRLKFRTQEFRSCILAYMTKEQLYSMRMEVADYLETNGPECAACKSKRTEGIDFDDGKDEPVRRYTIALVKCTCLAKRPILYSEISVLYSSVGMLFLPTYFKRKAAQSANDINLPVQALYFVEYAQETMPQYWLLSEDDKLEEESHFDPLVLEVSLKKSKVESFLLLGDTYQAAMNAFQAIEMLGLDYVCFHGIFNARAFKSILPKFPLLHAESITKLVGLLAKSYLMAHSYKLAQDLLRLEYAALTLYPIDFLQVLNHMTSMFQLKYLLSQKSKLPELERNMFRLCHEKLRTLDVLLDLTEVNTIGTAYAVVVESNIALGHLEKAANAAFEATRILQTVNDVRTLPKIRILLFHSHYHSKDYTQCMDVLSALQNMSATKKNRIYHALYITCLSMYLRITSDGFAKSEVHLQYDKCNAFAVTWKKELIQVIPKDLAFFISICLACWSLYSDKNTEWLAGKAFLKCYDLAMEMHHTIDKSKHNYWIISSTVFLLDLQMKCLKDKVEDFSVDEQDVYEEINYLKYKIKTIYPVYLKTYEKLVDTVEDFYKQELKEK